MPGSANTAITFISKLLKGKDEMKKIPTLFKREFKDHKVVNVLPEFTDELCKKAYFFGQPICKIKRTDFGYVLNF